MAQITRKWVADSAINNDKIDALDTYTITGLQVDGTNAVGRVGIGTDGVLDALHIHRVDTSAGLMLDLNDGTIGRNYQLYSGSNGAFNIQDYDTFTDVMSLTSAGRLGLTTVTPLDTVHAVSTVGSSALRLDLDDGALGRSYRMESNAAGSFGIVDVDASNATRLSIDSSGVVSFPGGVFFAGDASVGGNLHVLSDATVEGDFQVNGTTTIINTEVVVTDQLEINQTENQPALIASQDTAGGTVTATVVLIENASIANHALTVDQGFVGFGTTDPQAQLHVEGDIVGSLTATPSSIGSATRRISTLYMASQVNYSNNLFFYSAGPAAANAMVLDATTGHIGIGLTAPPLPAQRLQIDGGNLDVMSGNITVPGGDVTARGNITSTLMQVRAATGMTTTSGGFIALAGDISTGNGRMSCTGNILTTGGNVQAQSLNMVGVSPTNLNTIIGNLGVGLQPLGTAGRKLQIYSPLDDQAEVSINITGPTASINCGYKLNVSGTEKGSLELDQTENLHLLSGVGQTLSLDIGTTAAVTIATDGKTHFHGTELLLGPTTGSATLIINSSAGGTPWLYWKAGATTRASAYALGSAFTIGGDTGLTTTIRANATPALLLDTSLNARFYGNEVTVQPAAGTAQFTIDAGSTFVPSLYFKKGTVTKGYMYIAGDDMVLGPVLGGGLNLLSNGNLALTFSVTLDAEFYGSVGIGTAPLSKLHVVSTSGNILTVEGTTPSAYTTLNIDHPSSLGGRSQVVLEESGVASGFFRTAGGFLDVGSTSTWGDVRIYSRDTLAITLRPTNVQFMGNVGIGTTTSIPLHVVGTSGDILTVQGTTSGAYTTLNIDHPSSLGGRSQVVLEESGVASGFFRTAGGNIDVGSTSVFGDVRIYSQDVQMVDVTPTSVSVLVDLKVENALSGAVDHARLVTTGGIRLELKDGSAISTVEQSGNNMYINNGAGDLYFQTGGLNRGVIQNSTARWGMGTNAPQANLHVDDTGTLSYAMIEADTETANISKAGNLYRINGNDRAFSYAARKTTLVDYECGTSSGGGDVGIYTAGAKRIGIAYDTGKVTCNNAFDVTGDATFTGTNVSITNNITGTPTFTGSVNFTAAGTAVTVNDTLKARYFQINTALGAGGFVGNVIFDGNDITIYNHLTVGRVSETSDERLKTNVEEIKDALDIISDVKGVRFNWKEESKGTKRQIGLIAQEVEKVLPELVEEDKDGFKSIAYSKLTSVLVECVKELKIGFDSLQNRVEQIEEYLKK